MTAPARAAGPTPLDVRSLPEWWGAAGGPGQVDDLHMGNGLPFSWMGVVAGGVAMRDGLLPAFQPWPGLDEIAAPRAWYDSVEVVVGENAGWRGFSAALVELRAVAEPTRSRRPRAAFTMVNGSSAVDRTGLFLQRGGDDSWVRSGALTEERSGAGRLEAHGQHLWFADLGLRRGRHTWSGAFSQRGLAGGTRREDLGERFERPPYDGLEEAAHGEAGVLRWSWEREARRLRASLARSHDHRESIESLKFDLFAEREAQQNSLELEATLGSDERGTGARLELTQAQVESSEDFLNSIDPFVSTRPRLDARQNTAWLAVRDYRPFASGQLELQVGAGYTDIRARKGERLQMSPSAVWRVDRGTHRIRLHAGRYVTPVWSDLAPGVAPFVQDTWAAGGDLAIGPGGPTWVEVSGMVSETGNRALLQRWAVRDLALRNGWTLEGVRVQDALVQVQAGARRGAFGVDGLFWSRVRPVGTQAARVDPAVGGRAGAEAGFRAFAGDLAVRLRIETAWVGDRETEPLAGYFAPPEAVPGYFTSGASAGFTIGDADIVVRAFNLEDISHPQVWIDPTSPRPGTPAAGSGRQFRVEVSWPLFN